MRLLSLSIAAALIASFTVPAIARDFPYKRNVSLSVGQSVVLKGVRSGSCSTTKAPSWGDVSGKLPKPKLGTLSDGGAGMVNSTSCNGRTAARGVKFTAKKTGSERFVVFDDTISVTVK